MGNIVHVTCAIFAICLSERLKNDDPISQMVLYKLTVLIEPICNHDLPKNQRGINVCKVLQSHTTLTYTTIDTKERICFLFFFLLFIRNKKQRSKHKYNETFSSSRRQQQQQHNKALVQFDYYFIPCVIESHTHTYRQAS